MNERYSQHEIKNFDNFCYCTDPNLHKENRWYKLEAIKYKPSVFFIQRSWTLCQINLHHLFCASLIACSCFDRDIRCFQNS